MPADAPGLPYEVRTLQYGPNHLPTKFKEGLQTGEILTDDEVKVLEYVRHLEAERDRYRAEAEALTAPAPTVPAPKGKGK